MAQIVFNPSGTHLHKDKLKIRLDIFPAATDKAYTKHYYLDKKRQIWRLSPQLCLFVQVDSDITKELMQEWIGDILTPEVLATIDDASINLNSAHIISPYMKSRCQLSSSRVSTLNSQNILELNTRLEGISIGRAKGNPDIVIPRSIDVGAAAIDRASNFSDSYTIVNKENPANADGSVDTVEIYFAYDDVTSVKAGSFSASGDTLTCHDAETLGAPGGSGYIEFTGLDIAILTGEYLGAIGGTGNNIDRDTTGGSDVWYYAGDVCTPSASQPFSTATDDTASIYGTGTEAGTEISAGTASLTLTTYNPFILSPTGIAVGTAALTLTAYNPTVRKGLSVGNYKVYIDWNNDGDFTDTGEDITAGEGIKTITYSRGFDSQSGEASVGKCTLRLNNNNGTYNPLLHTDILPGRPIKIEDVETGNTLFTGVLENIQPYKYLTHQECVMTAVDNRDFLARAAAYLQYLYSDWYATDAIEELLDVAGWPAGLREYRGVRSDYLFKYWATGDKSVKDALDYIANATGGTWYIDHRGYFIWEDRDYTDASSGFTFNSNMISLLYNSNTKDIYNAITIKSVYSENTWGLDTAWLHTTDVSISDGDTFTYRARTNDLYSSMVGYVDIDWDWDGAAGSGITTALRTYGTYFEYDVTPNGGDIIVHSVTLNANKRTTTYADYTIEDATSISKYGRRALKIDTYIPYDSIAPPLATYLLAKYKDPRHELTITVVNQTPTLLDQIMGLKINELVTVVDAEFGVNGNYFIKHMQHDITEGGLIHKVTYRLLYAG